MYVYKTIINCTTYKSDNYISYQKPVTGYDSNPIMLSEPLLGGWSSINDLEENNNQVIAPQKTSKESVILLMAEIRLTSWGTGSLSHYLQGFSTIPGGCLGFQLVVEFPPIWKICASQIGSFPQGSGWKFQKCLKPPSSFVGRTQHFTKVQKNPSAFRPPSLCLRLGDCVFRTGRRVCGLKMAAFSFWPCTFWSKNWIQELWNSWNFRDLVHSGKLK